MELKHIFYNVITQQYFFLSQFFQLEEQRSRNIVVIIGTSLYHILTNSFGFFLESIEDVSKIRLVLQI